MESKDPPKPVHGRKRPHDVLEKDLDVRILNDRPAQYTRVGDRLEVWILLSRTLTVHADYCDRMPGRRAKRSTLVAEAIPI